MNYTQLIQDRNIKVCWKAYCSCFREILKPSAQGVLPIRLIVIVRTMGFFASNSMETRFDFKEFRMKFLFLPSMAEGAFVFILTSIFIRCDEILSVPVDAHVFWVGKNWWFSSIVLPVMSINTYISFMVILSVRTPNSLKMEQVEIHIRLKFFNQLYWKVILSMSKRTEFTIFAFRETI